MDELEDIEKYRVQDSGDDDIEQYRVHEPKEKTGLKGILSDAYDLRQSIVPSLISAGIHAPRNLLQFGQQLGSLPFQNIKYASHILKGLAGQEKYNPEKTPKLTANAIQGLVRTINLPGEGVNYLGRKGFIPKDLGHYIQGEEPDVGLNPDEENPISQSLLTLGGPATKVYEHIHPTMHLKNAKKLAIKTGANPIIPEHLLDEAAKYFPENEPSRLLIEEAKKGKYQKLFNVQSDLGKTGANHVLSPFGRDREHGFRAFDLRKRILNAMEESLEKGGHKEVADLMKRGQGNFRRFKKAGLALGTLTGYKPAKKIGKYLFGENYNDRD